jgi:hypothetical protein
VRLFILIKLAEPVIDPDVTTNEDPPSLTETVPDVMLTVAAPIFAVIVAGVTSTVAPPTFNKISVSL